MGGLLSLGYWLLGGVVGVSLLGFVLWSAVATVARRRADG